MHSFYFNRSIFFSVSSLKTSFSDKLRQVAASSTLRVTCATLYLLSRPKIYCSNSRRKQGEFIADETEWIAFRNCSESKSVTADASRSCLANFFLFEIALLLINAMKLLFTEAARLVTVIES